MSVFMPIPYSSDTTALQYSLKLDCVMPPILSSFKFALAIWALCGSAQLLRNIYSDVVGWNVLEIPIRSN